MHKLITLKSSKVFRTSRYVSSIDKGAIILKLVPYTHFCLGLIVTKKTGSAVTRNYIKRRIRHAFRLAKAMIKQEPKVACVILARKECITIEFIKLVKIISDVLGGL